MFGGAEPCWVCQEAALKSHLRVSERGGVPPTPPPRQGLTEGIHGMLSEARPVQQVSSAIVPCTPGSLSPVHSLLPIFCSASGTRPSPNHRKLCSESVPAPCSLLWLVTPGTVLWTVPTYLCALSLFLQPQGLCPGFPHVRG